MRAHKADSTTKILQTFYVKMYLGAFNVLNMNRKTRQQFYVVNH